MRNNFTLFFLLLFIGTANAQYFDAGVFVGTVNYQGDLSKSRFEPTEYNFACGGFLRYNATPHLSAKFMVNGGKVTGSDVFSGQRERNFNFNSIIIEAGVQGEYSLLDLKILDGGHIISPYFFAGLSGFYFNPRAEYRGSMVELRPLGTEGQGLEGYRDIYSNFSVAVPFGLGFKTAIHRTSTVGFELGFRKTFTDYLDDVSGYYPDQEELYAARGGLATALSYRGHEYDRNAPRTPGNGLRGNPQYSDWYFFGGVTLSINLPGGNKSFGKYPPNARSRSQRFHSQNPWYGF